MAGYLVIVCNPKVGEKLFAMFHGKLWTKQVLSEVKCESDFKVM